MTSKAARRRAPGVHPRPQRRGRRARGPPRRSRAPAARRGRRRSPPPRPRRRRRRPRRGARSRARGGRPARRRRALRGAARSASTPSRAPPARRSPAPARRPQPRSRVVARPRARPPRAPSSRAPPPARARTAPSWSRTPGANPSKRTASRNFGPSEKRGEGGGLDGELAQGRHGLPRRPPPASPSNTAVAEVSGSGWSRKTTSARSPSVPSEPQRRRGRSKPATFFTTLPPPCATTPSARTSVTPMTRSRTGP